MNRIVLSVSLPLSLLGLLQACSPSDDAKLSTAKPQLSATSAATEPTKTNTANDAAIAKDYTEKLFQNPYDADAVYFLSQRSGTPKALVVMIKRDSQQGVQYSRWQFDCVAQTAQNLGVATNMQDLNKSTNSMPTSPQHYELKTRLGAIATAVCP